MFENDIDSNNTSKDKNTFVVEIAKSVFPRKVTIIRNVLAWDASKEETSKPPTVKGSNIEPTEPIK